MNHQYDSGGKQKDPKAYRENFDKIFSGKWPCEECGNKQSTGHDKDCSKHWKNK